MLLLISEDSSISRAHTTFLLIIWFSQSMLLWPSFELWHSHTVRSHVAAVSLQISAGAAWWRGSAAVTVLTHHMEFQAWFTGIKHINRGKLCWIRASCSCSPFGSTAGAHAQPGSEFAELELFPYPVWNLEFSTSVCSHEHLSCYTLFMLLKEFILSSSFILSGLIPLPYTTLLVTVTWTRPRKVLRSNNLQGDSFLGYNPDQSPST